MPGAQRPPVNPGSFLPLGHVFPPILDRQSLPGRVLVVVAHPDDEIIGVGGLLAFHGRRGDDVRVIHATAGDAGDPDGRHDNVAKMRQGEVRAALAQLGIGAPECLGFEDGGLEQHADELGERLRAEFDEYAPELVYTFHGGEFHADHRTVAERSCEARAALPDGCRVHLFGVNQTVAFGALYDYSDLVEQKQAALACFKSQLAYLDFATKVMHRDQAATVNVELIEVTHAELIQCLCKDTWPRALELDDAALGFARRGEGS